MPVESSELEARQNGPEDGAEQVYGDLAAFDLDASAADDLDMPAGDVRRSLVEECADRVVHEMMAIWRETGSGNEPWNWEVPEAVLLFVADSEDADLADRYEAELQAGGEEDGFHDEIEDAVKAGLAARIARTLEKPFAPDRHAGRSAVTAREVAERLEAIDEYVAAISDPAVRARAAAAADRVDGMPMSKTPPIRRAEQGAERRPETGLSRWLPTFRGRPRGPERRSDVSAA